MATASGSGSNPTAPTALSDEQAEQFASSFTPSWATDDGLGDSANLSANATLVDAPAVGSAQAAAVVHAAPQPAAADAGANGGHAMRSAASSAEAIEPENILDSNSAPQPPVRAATPASVPPPAPAMGLKGTQIMQASPAQGDARNAPSRPHPATSVRGGPPSPAHARHAPVAVNADPFAASARAGRSGEDARRQQSTDDLDDFVPKKSNKTLYFVVAGLAVAAGLGLFLKFALTDDTPARAPVEHATGPAVTTAEIPPPPPKVDTPPPSNPATVAAAKVDPPSPSPVAPAPPPPPAARQPDPPAAPAHVAAPAQPPSRPRTPPPPPQAAALPPPSPPVVPKTPQKPANGSIVRDNPF